MKKTTILTLLTCLMAMASRADVIFQELFNYTNGPIAVTSTNGTGSTTISNWITFSGSQDAFVNNRRLEVSTSPARSGDVNRQFSQTNDSSFTNSQQLIYASFIINFTNLPSANGAYFAHFHSGLPTSSSFEGKLWALAGNPVQTSNNFVALPNTFRLGVTAANSGGPTSRILAQDLALNTDYQVVLCWDPVTDFALSVWVNPISSSDPKVESSDPFTPSASSLANSIAFRQATGFGGFLTVSNLVVATSFDEAFTNVLATNAVAPTIVYQPVGVTNFVGSTFNVAAVANGQGLVNMTYQWFQGATPYSNPNGNTNVLTFVNAQTTDSGDYKVVATTPYGLSVTSAVAHVSISATPVPPAFTAGGQPASQIAFTGQGATFTATVVSPGNVTFTWYSNNVVVTDGVSSSGVNSSLTITPVQIGFSGTQYKVAVTNDIVSTGIVSSNAVLTVSNPPTVSIAFLRSLIDPATFVTTANPNQPYQVTGVITSAGSPTAGNNASYYLQDATAAINIFATFASTFRPNQGDVVTFTGVLSTFNNVTGGLELFADTVNRTYTSYSIVSNNFPLPTPRVIPFNVTNIFGYLYYNTNLQASYVTITNVFFGTNAGLVLPTVNTAVSVTNGAGLPFVIEFFGSNSITAGQTLPEYASSITGNLIGQTPSLFLSVNQWTDINTNVPIAPSVPIPLGFGVAGGVLTFNWTDPAFNLQWATNVLGPYATIPGAATGFTTNVTALPALFFRLSTP